MEKKVSETYVRKRKKEQRHLNIGGRNEGRKILENVELNDHTNLLK